MQSITNNELSKTSAVSDKRRPTVAVAGAKRKAPATYLVKGAALGIIFGLILGSALALIAGERSLLLVQHLWDRLSGADSDSEHVHFEWLLQ